MRDMVGAMVVLVVIIGVVMGFYGSCSFSPGGPSVDPNAVPTADASAHLERTARSVAFPLREPAVPKGWRANSASTASVGAGEVVVRVGWVTSAGTYLQLSQSGGAVADVLVKETDRQEAPSPSGTVDVDGTTWTSYPARRDEPAWVTELDGTVLLITGSAAEEEFRALATATQLATPLAAS
jgi:uncharacterized protein DUF4245